MLFLEQGISAQRLVRDELVDTVTELSGDEDVRAAMVGMVVSLQRKGIISVHATTRPYGEYLDEVQP